MDRTEPSTDAHEAVRALVSLIRSARYLTAFTGAGISVESGIPPFRGEGGIWNTHDPRKFELDYFMAHPEEAWPLLKQIFYGGGLRAARPNRAHEVLAAWEARGAGLDGRGGLLKVLITQNIDNLHSLAGSRRIIEFHGNSRLLLCVSCGKRVEAEARLLQTLPPRCGCGGIYKPDFVFFGEGIPPVAHERAREAARRTDLMLVVGTTGEVYPAALIPQWAAEAGAKIVEINPAPSSFTGSVTDVRIPLPAAEAFRLLEEEMNR